jgi:hypothetical protein
VAFQEVGQRLIHVASTALLIAGGEKILRILRTGLDY